MIIDLAEPGRRTVLFSTHITSDLERVADRVAILKSGRIAWQGLLEDLKEQTHVSLEDSFLEMHQGAKQVIKSRYLTQKEGQIEQLLITKCRKYENTKSRKRGNVKIQQRKSMAANSKHLVFFRGFVLSTFRDQKKRIIIHFHSAFPTSPNHVQ